MQENHWSSKKKNIWMIDSGCSRHLTGDASLFLNINKKASGAVTFANNETSNIIGKGSIGNEHSIKVSNVLLVEGVKFNLLSVSQLCDNDFEVCFTKNTCLISHKLSSFVMHGYRVHNVFYVNFDNVHEKFICMSSVKDDVSLWHRRLGHASIGLISKLCRHEHVRGLPKIRFESSSLCDACQLGKLHKTSFPSVNQVSTSNVLDLLHMDLFGEMDVTSLGGSKYVFVIIDDFSRYTWTIMLANKSDAFNEFAKLCRKIQNQKNRSIKAIRSDHGGEYENSAFVEYCDLHGIQHNFSAPRTPQQNGVVERKNRTIQEMGRTMLNEHNLPKYFWGHAVSTACHVINRVSIRPILKKTPYELWNERRPNISYFKVFGCKCYILNTKDKLGKFDAKSTEGIFLGYSEHSKAYVIYNKKDQCIQESIHVSFNEADPFAKSPKVVEEEVEIVDKAPVQPVEQVTSEQAEQNQEVVEEQSHEDPLDEGEDTTSDHAEDLNDNNHGREYEELPRVWKEVKGHPPEQIIGDRARGVTTRSSIHNTCLHTAFVSLIVPKNIKEALADPEWVLSMQKELEQFERNKVWHLVEKPHDRSIIGTKWVFRNKLDESGNVLLNKSRLVVQGFSQIEGVDFEETFAPVARLESIRIILAFASHMDFKLHQMDVKSAFLNGFLEEEVYVAQPPGFEDYKNPDYVFKLDKALYGLKQAPRAWYERLSKHLIANGFIKGKIDHTLFLKTKGKHIIVVQIYVDDIIFGSTDDTLCDEFSAMMTNEFEMSMMGELNFFLGLQVKQLKEGIFINQSKFSKELLKKYNMTDAKEISTPMATSTKLDKDEAGVSVNETLYRGMIGSLLYLTASRPDIMFAVCLCARFQACPKESHLKAVKRILRYVKGTIDFGLWYPKSDYFALRGYSDADFAGCTLDRKSTSGTCHFLGNSLTSWSSKKQNSVALSTAEAEYVAAGNCVAQILWMKQTLEDFGLKYDHVPVLCDNTSAINIAKNPIQHSRTKHIEIRHHFIRDHVQKGSIDLSFVGTDDQLADIFTKPLADGPFSKIRRELGMLDFSSI